MRNKLESARQDHLLVRLWRDTIEEGFATGYVTGVGPEFFLFCVVGDEITFNGFHVMRIGDVTELEAPHEFSGFIERALHLRKEIEPVLPDPDLSTVRSIIESVTRSFPLVTIHREDVSTEVCHIGRAITVDDDCVRLREMSPDAVLYDEPEDYLLREITRIDFGGGYERALWLVGGED